VTEREGGNKVLERGSARVRVQITCEEGGMQEEGNLQALLPAVRGEEGEDRGQRGAVFEEGWLDGGGGARGERNLQPLALAVRGEEGEGSEAAFELGWVLCVGMTNGQGGMMGEGRDEQVWALWQHTLGYLLRPSVHRALHVSQIALQRHKGPHRCECAYD
jgi:hypothetical protein